MGQDEKQQPLVTGSERKFKTRNTIGWYSLRAHEYGARKVRVALKKREAEYVGDDDPWSKQPKKKRKKKDQTRK